MSNGILRQPFAVLGGLGLVGLVDQAINWQRQLGQWVMAWASFSNRVAEFTFGWLVDLLPFTMPVIWKDYATMSLLTAAALLRSNPLRPQAGISVGVRAFGVGVVLSGFLLLGLLWPLVLAAHLNPLAHKVQSPIPLDERRKNTRIFLELFVWAAAIVALNAAWVGLEA